MSQKQVQIVQARIDGEIKAQAVAALATMGLSVSDAIRLLLTKVAHEKCLPSELFIPNTETLKAMQEADDNKGEIITLDDIKAVFRENH